MTRCPFCAMKATIATVLILALTAGVRGSAPNDPYSTLSETEKERLKPQIERWIHDQLKHDWSDMWQIQDQTPDLKNELLLGRRYAPDMDREEYVQAMRNTIGTGIPETKAFRLTEVDTVGDGFQIVGCAKMQREDWKQTSIQHIHVRLANGKALFGLPKLSPEKCKL